MSDLRGLIAKLTPEGRTLLMRHLLDAGVAPPPPQDDPVAVVGIGCRFPGGATGPDDYLSLLGDDRDVIGPVPADRWEVRESDGFTVGAFLPDIAGFDAEFFGISPAEAAGMDPQQRLLLEVAWEALEHAALDPDTLRGSKTGVFVGMSSSDYLVAGIERGARVDGYTTTGTPHSTAVGRVSYVLGLRGPCVAVDTACSSSLTAIHLACQSLRSGESNVALAGGVHLIAGAFTGLTLSKWGMLSPTGGCHAFDEAADGFVRGEGCGVVVLKRLSDAQRDGDRILGVVRGSAVNHDGRSNGLTAPSGVAQKEVLASALASARIDPGTVGLIEAHGSGTRLGDPIEFEALDSVYGRGRGRCALGAVKSVVGHLEAAAGVAGFIKAVLSVHSGVIPPNQRFTRWNPEIDAGESRLFVPTESVEWPVDGPRVAGVSAFGFGGTNAHVLVEQPPAHHLVENAPGAVVVPLSGASAEQVRDVAAGLADWLRSSSASLADVAATQGRRGAPRRFRAAVVARDREGALAGLADVRPVAATPPGPGVVFVFPGQGGQWVGMGRRLLAEEPVFAAAIDELGMRSALLGEPHGIDQVQPLLFGVQVALARLWESTGVRPAAVIGHSMGEVAAAVVAGALTPQQGLRVITTRSRLLTRVAGRGSMASLVVSAEEAQELVGGDESVGIAVYASPESVVIAGDTDAVTAIVGKVEAGGGHARLIEVDVASHSPQVDSLLNDLARELAGIVPAAPKVSVYSTVDNNPRRQVVFDAGHWVTNLRAPVRFEQAVAAAAEDGYRVFVEVSPHPVLVHAIGDTAAGLVLPTLRRDEDDTVTFHTHRAELHNHGVVPLPVPAGRVVNTPTTPWRHTRYWLPEATSVRDTHPLLGVHVALPNRGHHAWHARVGLRELPWLTDHRVFDRIVLPGAGYVEIALAAGSVLLDDPFEVR
ncbi:hypothetical protein ALI144C_51030 [Actinosynnema sp. ALI-1.44]|uniref:type I polyketide synthase n=1 Tax=Actinosynnema sp. ALI-1.44 TaxID=1933779 RepID=UPI00097C2870|nr:type I polyketide synthase [Actinosynnema sp. ALI-1.44]ONI70916.1 hypothetical protein ALI144C_51030 [Actinosynnema sp. ALI-1.44]